MEQNLKKVKTMQKLLNYSEDVFLTHLVENITPPNKAQKTTLGQTIKELNAAPEECCFETEQESYAQKRANFQ